MTAAFRPDWTDEVAGLAAQALASGSVAQARKAMKAAAALDGAQPGRELAVGLCSTFVVLPQLPLLELALAAEGFAPQLIPGELDNVEQELLDPSSPVLAAGPDAVVVLWRLEELAPALVDNAFALAGSDREDIVDGVVGRIEALIEGYGAAVPLFLSTLPMPAHLPWRLADAQAVAGVAAAVAEINAKLFSLAAGTGRVHVFDFAGWAAGFGAEAFSEKMDLFARQPIAGPAFGGFARALAGTLAPLKRPRAKVLALDLDNTLWGGVLGEDGLAGLKIGHDFPGNVFRRLQLAARALKHQGVLLVLLSKNNLADVEEAFSALPDMPLRLDDFADIRVDWQPKHENLKAAAAALNLGLDACVFLDDQPFERTQMRHFLPEVTVLEPADGQPLSMLDALRRCAAFDALKLSREDLDRHGEYHRQRRREQLQSQAGSLTEFLFSLELRATLAPVAPANLGRVVQMLAKTNQFNLTTRRHGEAELAAMLAAPRAHLLTVALADRFGDQGIVGLVLAVPSPADPDTLVVDSLLLSCRVLGRGVEQLLWSEILRRASADGYRRLEAEYVRSAKNGQVAELYERFGMDVIERGGDVTRYGLGLPAEAPAPEWISLVR